MEQTQQFPAEEVTLPSKGLLYPEESPLRSGIIEMKYMTAKEEDILTNANFIQNGTVIDKLLQSLIVTKFDYNDLLIGDKNAILVAARILGYGGEYTFTQNGQEYTVNLADLKDKPLDESLVADGKNEFNFKLPASEVDVTFKFLTHGDESKIQQELKGLKKIRKNEPETLVRWRHTIISINGNSDPKEIREFINNRLLARDARALRNYIKKIQPDVDLTFDHEDQGGNIVKINVPVGLKFFWPDAEL